MCDRSMVTLAGGVGSATLISLGPSKEEVFPKLDEMEERLRISRQIAAERRAQAEETGLQIATARRNIELQLSQAEYAAKESALLELEANKAFRKIRDLMSEKEALASQLASLGGELDFTMNRLSDLEGMSSSIMDSGRSGGSFVLGFKQGLGNFTPNQVVSNLQSGHAENDKEFKKLLEEHDYDAAWDVINSGITDVKTLDDQFFQMLEGIQDKKFDLRSRNDRIQERISELSSKVDEARARIQAATSTGWSSGMDASEASSRTTGRSNLGTASTLSSECPRSLEAPPATSTNSMCSKCYVVPVASAKSSLSSRCNGLPPSECPKCGATVQCGCTCPCSKDKNNANRFANRCANNARVSETKQSCAQDDVRHVRSTASSGPRVHRIVEDTLRAGMAFRRMESKSEEDGRRASKGKANRRDFSSQYNQFPAYRNDHPKTVDELLSMVRDKRDSSPEGKKPSPAHRREPQTEEAQVPRRCDDRKDDRSEPEPEPKLDLEPEQEPEPEVRPEPEAEVEEAEAEADPECVLELRMEAVNSSKVGKGKVVEKFVRLTQLFKSKKKAQLAKSLSSPESTPLPDHRP